MAWRAESRADCSAGVVSKKEGTWRRGMRRVWPGVTGWASGKGEQDRVLVRRDEAALVEQLHDALGEAEDVAGAGGHFLSVTQRNRGRPTPTGRVARGKDRG